MDRVNMLKNSFLLTKRNPMIDQKKQLSNMQDQNNSPTLQSESDKKPNPGQGKSVSKLISVFENKEIFKNGGTKPDPSKQTKLETPEKSKPALSVITPVSQGQSTGSTSQPNSSGLKKKDDVSGIFPHCILNPKEGVSKGIPSDKPVPSEFTVDQIASKSPTLTTNKVAKTESSSSGSDSEQKKKPGAPQQNQLQNTSNSGSKVGSNPEKNGPKPTIETAHTILKKIEQDAKIRKDSDDKRIVAQITDPNDPNYRLSVADFMKLNSLGKGSYAEVALVKRISNGKLYALKAIDLTFMRKEQIQEGKEYQTAVEKEVLFHLDHPNIIKMIATFKENNKLYFVLEYVSGGEFADFLKIRRKLPKEQTRFFAAEIINILEYLHNSGIAHRDLKPENLLITNECHLKCIDFGTARFLNTNLRPSQIFQKKKAEDSKEMESPDDIEPSNAPRSTFVGTAQYVAPEMLEESECSAPADIWALGCMIYQMEIGKYPFHEINEYQTFQKIKSVDIKYPEDMDPQIKDLLQKILVKNPYQRLGTGRKGTENDFAALKSHPFFEGIDFENLHTKPPNFKESLVALKRGSVLDIDQDDILRVRKASETKDKNQNLPVIEKSATLVLSGLADKKCGWLFYKPRQLILNSKPQLVYYDPETNQLRGEIILAPETKAELESKTKFVITTPLRKYYFKQIEHSAEKWTAAINEAVKKKFEKPL